MEDFTAAADRSSIEYCKERVADCDLFVSLIGHIYGSMPPGQTRSYTEQEYEAAPRHRLIFLAPPDFPVAAKLILSQTREEDDKQAAFRERAGADQHPGRSEFFDSPDKLAANVVAALRNWEAEQPGGGYTDPLGIHVGEDPAGLPPSSAFKDVLSDWCPVMVVLPAGQFMMGSPTDDKDAYPEEFPSHQVNIGYRFAIGRFPVTFDEYDVFCEETMRRPPYDEHWGRGKRPVINVCWSDANDYAAWLSLKTGQQYRLASESEWEYACRAGTQTRFSFGQVLTKKHANFGHAESGRNHPLARTSVVGAFPANPWGLYDMHGNVWEHVLDSYHETYDHAPCDGSPWLESGDDSDRVVRGGSFSYDAKDNRAAVRCFHAKDTPDMQHGFRVVRVIRGDGQAS